MLATAWASRGTSISMTHPATGITEGLWLFPEDSGTECLCHCPLLPTESAASTLHLVGEYPGRNMCYFNEPRGCPVLSTLVATDWTLGLGWRLCAGMLSVFSSLQCLWQSGTHVFFIFLRIWVSSVLCVIPVVSLFCYYLIVIVLWSWTYSDISARNSRNKSSQKGWDSEIWVQIIIFSSQFRYSQRGRFWRNAFRVFQSVSLSLSLSPFVCIYVKAMQRICHSSGAAQIPIW